MALGTLKAKFAQVVEILGASGNDINYTTTGGGKHKFTGDVDVQGDVVIAGGGQVIGYTYVRVDTQHNYSALVGSQTEMPEMSLVVTPKRANSILHCQWFLHGESTNHETGFRVMVNGVLAADGYNTFIGYQNWSTLASNLYDGNDNSTPRITPIHYIYVPGTTATQTISPAVHSTNTSTKTYRMNRTAGSTGANLHECGVSWAYVWEIAQ